MTYALISIFCAAVCIWCVLRVTSEMAQLMAAARHFRDTFAMHRKMHAEQEVWSIAQRAGRFAQQRRAR